MTVARREMMGDGEAVYHCISRCVRRAYLCGYDILSGRSYDHRKQWVLDRLRFLSEVFSIEVLGYALMSTHSHLMLRTRPDLLEGLTDVEIALRWLKLYPLSGTPEQEVVLKHAQHLAADRERIVVLRRRLGSISWFMKSLNEHVARRANREDDCTGRFWEGRFKSQRLYDDAAVLSCAIYIDLNPIRAKISKTPEESEFTSAFERIHAHRRAPGGESELWLAPPRDFNSRRGFLSMSFPEYLSLLDATGRELQDGKRGRIPDNLAPILRRIGVNPDHWLVTCRYFRRWFSHSAGNVDSLRKAAAKMGKSWCWGTRVAKRAFI